MAAFKPTESDVDVIVLVNESLNETLRGRLRDRIGDIPLPALATGLDLGVLTTGAARDMTEGTCWEASIRVSRDPTGQQAYACERSDSTLFMDVAVVHRHGIALAGPSVEESFGIVDPRLVLNACAENVRVWARRDVFHDPASGLLTACRAWMYLDEGILVSKPEAGTWASSKLEDSSLVDAALARRSGDNSRCLADADVNEFCNRVLRLLENHVADS